MPQVGYTSIFQIKHGTPGDAHPVAVERAGERAAATRELARFELRLAEAIGPIERALADEPVTGSSGTPCAGSATWARDFLPEPLAVEPVELRGDFCRFDRVILDEQSDPEVGAAGTVRRR